MKSFCSNMEKQRQVLYFIISDTESLADHLLENVFMMLHDVLDLTQLNIVKSDQCSDLLLTLNCFVDQRGCIIENKIMECFELRGHIVCVTQFEFDKAVIMKFETGKKIEELIIELQTKEIFMDLNGSALNVKTLTENKKMSMIIAIFFSKIDDISLSDFVLIENLSQVYQIRRPEIIEIFFGKRGIIEESVEQIWIHPKHTQNNKNKNVTSEMMLCEEMSRKPLTPKDVKNWKTTENYKKTINRNLSSEKSRNILIYGAFSSGKCKLLENICKKFSQSDCKMMVNHELKEVNIVGRNFGLFQKYVKMIETQLTMFHWKEINFSRKLFNHLTKNNNIIIRFKNVLIENKFDSVILVENSLERPVAFGINKTITDNFIKWLEKEFIKESFKLHCPIENHESNYMKYSLSLLELNHLVSIEVIDDEVMIQGLSIDVSSVIPDVKRIISKHTSILGQPPTIQNPQQNYCAIYFEPPSDFLLAPTAWIKNQEMNHFQKDRSNPHPKCIASSSLLSTSVSKPTSPTTHILTSKTTLSITSAISLKPSNIIPSTPSAIELPLKSKVVSSVIKIGNQCSESSSAIYIDTPVTMPLVAFTLNKSHSNHDREKIYDEFVTFTDPSSSSSSSKENYPLRLPVTVTTHTNPSNTITTFVDISSSSSQLSTPSLLPPLQSLSSTIKTSTNGIREIPLSSSFFYKMDNILKMTASQSIVSPSECLVNTAKPSSRKEYPMDSTNINNTVTSQASIKLLTSEHTVVTSQSLTTMHRRSLISIPTDATKISQDRNEDSMLSGRLIPTKTPACKQFIETPTQYVITSTTSSHLKLASSTQSTSSHTALTTAKTLVNKSSETVQVSTSNLLCNRSSRGLINDLASFKKSCSLSISPIISTPSARTMHSLLVSNQTSSSTCLTTPSKRNTPNPSQSIVSPSVYLVKTAKSSSIKKCLLDSSSNINNTTTRQASIKSLTSESRPPTLATSQSLMKKVTMDQQPLISISVTKMSQDRNEGSMLSSRSIPTKTSAQKQSIETQSTPIHAVSTTAESLTNKSSKITLKVSESNLICNRSSRCLINDLAAFEKSFSPSINESPIISTPPIRTMHSSLTRNQTTASTCQTIPVDSYSIPNPPILTTALPVNKNAFSIQRHASSSSKTISKNTYADPSTLGLSFISPMDFGSSVELQEFINPSKLSQQECYQNSRSEEKCSIL